MRISDWSSDVCSSDLSDAQRIEQLGAQNVHVTGNSKFDVTPPEEQKRKGEALRAQFGGRRILLCANTRDGEEALILGRSEEHTSELQSLMSNSYAVFCLKKKKEKNTQREY